MIIGNYAQCYNNTVKCHPELVSGPHLYKDSVENQIFSRNQKISEKVAKQVQNNAMI